MIFGLLLLFSFVSLYDKDSVLFLDSFLLKTVLDLMYLNGLKCTVEKLSLSSTLNLNSFQIYIGTDY